MAWDTTSVFYALSTLCATVFLFCLPFRIWELHTPRNKALNLSRHRIIKFALGILLSLLLTLYLIEVFASSVPHETSQTNLVLSLLASLLGSLGLSLLSLVEQQRCLQSSDLAILYLVAAIFCDAVLLTLRIESGINTGISRPTLVRCFIHLIILILECIWDRNPILNNARSLEESSNILGRVFFTWINSVLLQGYQNILVDHDLPPLNRNMKTEFVRKVVLKAWNHRDKPESKKTLPLVLQKALKIPFISPIIPRLFLIVFRYSQPTLIKLSIRFVVTYSESEGREYGEWLVIAAVAIYIGLAISTSIYQHRLNKLRLLTRSALVCLIHDKTMKLPSLSYDDGESTTLMSTDADSLAGIGEMFHEIWAHILEVILGIFLLATEVRWFWPVPLFLIFLCSHMSRYVAKHLEPRQKAWNRTTQSRVAATSSLIGSMKVVKMLGFQQHLADRIRGLRIEELSVASKLRWIMVYYNASANALGIFSPAITLVFFAFVTRAQGHNLDTETAFTTVAILTMVTHPANMVMTIMPRVVASFAAFDRIQAFLLRSSLHDLRGRLPQATSKNSAWDPRTGFLTRPGPVILIQNLKIGGSPLILKNINIEVLSGSFVIVSGPTGCGKSTLLRTMLGETPLSYGSVKVSTKRIAYCAQKPWIPSGTIRDVICGTNNRGQIDEEWYSEVISQCCLTYDLDLLAAGDETQVGSRGLNLSGGQRQRVALARALFAKCDIVLLDDCFSVLDGETEKDIFANLLGSEGSFRLKSTVILVSNSTQYFENATQIIILGDHGIKEQGSWQTIKLKAASISKFTTTPQIDNSLTENFNKLRAQCQVKDEAKKDLSRQTGDSSLYSYYIRFAGWTSILILVAFTASYSFFITIPQYWLRVWTESGEKSSVFYTCGFLLLAVGSWSSTNGIMWSTVILLAPKSGKRLHEHLLHIVTSAPLSFFSQTENGSILNRFSQDIQLIDKQLPTALSNISTQIFKLLMQGVLLFISQKWLALSLPACLVIVYIIQKIYLRTSRQLRFLELESRAAVFSSFLESVEGLQTIRSFGWSRKMIEENVLCIEKSQRPEFLLFSLQRWLNIVLDLLASALATGVVSMAVFFRGHISGGEVGIALNIMLVANNTLLKLVENWTTLEISLGAISRLKMLWETTPSEGKSLNFEPLEDWPSKGKIEFKNVTASYNSEAVALQNLSLIVNGGQKIVICGRTGSGKSTLILTLLRILELHSGKIELDGVDISRVRLELLRQRCFITVSQDALLLSNETLRFNLDPDASLPDEVLISMLARTGLWSHFSKTTIDSSVFGNRTVLNTNVSMSPELSTGQSQLFALCRALLKINTVRYAGVKPVILLDEVTSSLDPVMESVINSLIEEEFTAKGYTVIIVAHRLAALTQTQGRGTVAVALMRNGRLQELVTDRTQSKVEIQ